MPTILRLEGLVFRILLRDHDPPHVHVYDADGMAKIGLGDEDEGPSLMKNEGMSPKMLRKAVRIVEDRQDWFLRAWRKHHA
jgi:hypothetical protein